MRKLVLALVAVIALASAAVSERHRLLFGLTEGAPPELGPATEEGPDVAWVDDYYTVEQVAPDTFAIGEPRYYQQNFNYLIVGRDEAILFDAGSGLRDAAAVAARLTDVPITFVPSHFHYDHVGNGIDFARIAIIDLPHLRERAADNVLRLEWGEHLGTAEGYAPSVFRVDRWLAPGSDIDLGGRTLRVLFTPGHTWDSVSLYDAEADILFSGDFIYPGNLYGFLPTSRLGDYQHGVARLLDTITADTVLYGAHRVAPPGAPRQSRRHVEILGQTLADLEAGRIRGEGIYPVAYPAGEDMVLLVEPRFLHDWSRTYPELEPTNPP